MSSTKRVASEDATSAAKRVKADWHLPASDISVGTINPIRAIIDTLVIPKGATKEKPMIPLSIGDPCVFGNLLSPETAGNAVSKAIASGKLNGYCPSTGLLTSREAIAKKLTNDHSPLTADDVIITSGCSGALTLAIQALCSKGDNILLPMPGFSLYATAAGHSSINVKYYNLLPEKQWECDLASMEAAIDDRTTCILVNNPSNPTGSNYSKAHLEAILAVAEKHKLAVIADEIYADMVFKGEKFHAMADLTSEVPVLSCRGLAKQFLLPGWRVGWITIHDRKERFKDTRGALQRLSTLILGACTIVQAAIPDILFDTPANFFTELNDKLETNAKILIEHLSKIKCLNLIKPQGAMYLMIGIDSEKFVDIKDEMEFTQKLLDEEFVFALPGSCFKAPNFIRLVTCPPPDMLTKAVARIADFCDRHAKPEYK